MAAVLLASSPFSYLLLRQRWSTAVMETGRRPPYHLGIGSGSSEQRRGTPYPHFDAHLRDTQRLMQRDIPQ